MRTIKIGIEKEELEKLSALGKPFSEAIAYLALWGLTYGDLEIYKDGKGFDMIAYYRRTDGFTGNYTIGAIWRAGENKYSFHS